VEALVGLVEGQAIMQMIKLCCWVHEAGRAIPVSAGPAEKGYDTFVNVKDRCAFEEDC
jgi:hypothetical protein